MQAVVEIQSRLPNARVLYVSATGATEAENLCYMTRLGLWGDKTAFPNKHAFVTMLQQRGVGELVSDVVHPDLICPLYLTMHLISFQYCHAYMCLAIPSIWAELQLCISHFPSQLTAWPCDAKATSTAIMTSHLHHSLCPGKRPAYALHAAYHCKTCIRVLNNLAAPISHRYAFCM